jgi:hypothetical protein
MTIKYDWSIVSLKYKKNDKDEDIITEVIWRKRGVDEEGHEGSFEGLLDPKTVTYPDNYKFLPYNKLKEADVIKWVKMFVSESLDDHVNNIIAKQIEEKKLIVVEDTFPWSKGNKKNK